MYMCVHEYLRTHVYTHILKVIRYFPRDNDDRFPSLIKKNKKTLRVPVVFCV